MQTPGSVQDDTHEGRAFRAVLSDALAVAKSNLSLAQARQKYHADKARQPSPFKRGDEVLLDADLFHFDELQEHKLCRKWYGPLRVIDADAETVKLRTPMDKQFHCRVHSSACKLYVRASGDQPPMLPDSQIDKDKWDIKAVVGHRWNKGPPRQKEFKVKFAHPPHDVPASDEWIASSDLSATKLVKGCNKLLKQGYLFAEVLSLHL